MRVNNNSPLALNSNLNHSTSVAFSCSTVPSQPTDTIDLPEVEEKKTFMTTALESVTTDLVKKIDSQRTPQPSSRPHHSGREQKLSRV